MIAASNRLNTSVLSDAIKVGKSNELSGKMNYFPHFLFMHAKWSFLYLEVVKLVFFRVGAGIYTHIECN